MSSDTLTYSTLVLATLALYLAAGHVSRRARGHAILNPVLIGALGVAGVLALGNVPHDVYRRACEPISFLLAPAVAALAIPIYRNASLVMVAPVRLSLAIVVGSLVGTATTILGLTSLGFASVVVASAASKSVTTAVAIGIAERIGGLPELAAIVSIATGITGAVAGAWVLSRLGVATPLGRGLSYGTAAHVIGTNRAREESELTAAFAAVAMTVNAIVTAIVLPITWLLVMSM